MTVSYRGQVAVAFEVLAEGLAPFVDSRMTDAFPDEDWVLTAATKLGKRRDVLVSLSDPHFQLEVINRWWGPAFGNDLDDSLRQTVTDLRTARNHWAHPDEDHPFDFDYALTVHQDAEEILRAVRAAGAADRMVELMHALRWDSVRDAARSEGRTEVEALMDQLVGLQKQFDDLNAQLDEARDVARSATGRQRAIARQLAELQSQYAAVAGLRDEYLTLRRQLEAERAKRESVSGDTSSVGEQLDRATSALDRLQSESEALRGQLASARASLHEINLVDTPVGRRWIWMVSFLLVFLAVLVAVAARNF
jgi:hypothetical protein